MRRHEWIILSVAIALCCAPQLVGAATVAYTDSSQSSLTGVVGAKYTGTSEGYGLFGWASAGAGEGTAGVYGLCASSSGAGVSGWANATFGSTHGVYGLSSSPLGTGVYGLSDAASGVTKGVHGESHSVSGTGVAGVATATTGATKGVYGLSSGTSGTGVYGRADAISGNTRGVYGENASTTGIAVYGLAFASGGTNYGVYGWSYSNSGRGVYGRVSSPTGPTYGVYGDSLSKNGRGVFGFASSNHGVNYGVFGKTSSPNGYGVYSKGNMHVDGDFTASGTKSAVVELANGEGITLYAEESAENWFADYGSSALKDGKAVVGIDPSFAQTVNTKMEYHVFLTPRGDCRGLYVGRLGENSFEVGELDGGSSNVSFSYRIVAKRVGHEKERLAKIEKAGMMAVASPAEEPEHPEETLPEKVAVNLHE